jgi:peroxiredoxin
MNQPTPDLSSAHTQFGTTLAELSANRPLLLIFLRHLGCTFCREALADAREQRKAVAATGTQLAFVHMGDEQQGTELFSRYGLSDVPRVSDPEAKLYKAFRLKRGRLRQVMGPRVWVRGFESFIKNGHPVGFPIGDTLQMPGVFLIQGGHILRSYFHQTSADRVNYQAFVAPGTSDQ